MPTSLEIRRWIVSEIAAGRGRVVASRAAERFSMTRQAIGRHLRKLRDQGEITAKGQTRGRQYELAVLEQHTQDYALGPDFHEDVVWSETLHPILSALPTNIVDICEYGVTEMLNNARDHSGSRSVTVSLSLTSAQLSISVRDLGVGIFRKIKEAYVLDHERHAILELVKGRLTTDPEHHTGEGIFFTSRAFDAFILLAGSMSLIHRREGGDWLVEDASPTVGTHVTLKIQTDSKQTLKEVFDHYATERDDYAFQKTQLSLALAQTDGSSLVSRSQGKRTMARCERFREVSLDFQNVESIGPAFADEIFRVWRRAHPNTTLVPIRMNADVEKMVRRALATETPEGPPA